MTAYYNEIDPFAAQWLPWIRVERVAFFYHYATALPFALANALVGGTAEFVALAFKQAGRETWFFTYVTVVIAGSLAVYTLMRDTRRHSRIAED